MHRLGAFATIFDEAGRVLLVHRRDVDLWEAPGGTVEDGEPPWRAVVREVTEETGLVVQVQRLAGLYWRPDRDLLVFQFLCTAHDGTLRVSDENDEVRYFSFDALPERLTPVVRDRLQDSRTDGLPVWSVQDGVAGRDFGD